MKILKVYDSKKKAEMMFFFRYEWSLMLLNPYLSQIVNDGKTMSIVSVKDTVWVVCLFMNLVQDS